MSNLVGNPEDRFSGVAAQLVSRIIEDILYWETECCSHYQLNEIET